MKKTVTIILIISSLGLLATGIAIPEDTSKSPIITEIHGSLSLIFCICFFIHLKTHLRTFIKTLK